MWDDIAIGTIFDPSRSTLTTQIGVEMGGVIT